MVPYPLSFSLAVSLSLSEREKAFADMNERFCLNTNKVTFLPLPLLRGPLDIGQGKRYHLEEGALSLSLRTLCFLWASGNETFVNFLHRVNKIGLFKRVVT